ncbi:hypothetical protein BIW11_04785, partial [Tropilaelaps mercedesae]
LRICELMVSGHLQCLLFLD